MRNITYIIRPVIRLFIISWSKALVYRADITVFFFFSLASPLVALAVWYSVMSNDNSIVSGQYIITYYLFVMLVELITRSWRGVFLVNQILEGKIVPYLIRPRAILWEFIATNVTTKILQLSLPLAALLSVIVFLPELFVSEIYQLSNIGLFVISISLAVILWFCFDLSIGMLAFWLEDAQELHGYRFLLMQFASGIIIPFFVMPDLLRQVLSWLPFRYVISAPVEIIIGQTESAWQLIGIQALWALGFIMILRFLFVKGLRRYAVPGQ